MTDQNNPTWADFAGFGGVSKENLSTSFNDSVGGAFFDVGKHKDVTIESIEPKISKAGNQYLKVVFTNDDGASMQKAVLLKNRDGNVHFSYSQLAAAVVKDRELRLEAFSVQFVDNPALLDSLRGMKVSIKVGLGKEGYIIQKGAIDNQYKLIDVETSAPYPEVANMSFEGYTEAKEKADELQISRCYNNIDSITRGSLDAVTANEEALQEALRVAGETAGGVTQIQSKAAVPNI